MRQILSRSSAAALAAGLIAALPALAEPQVGAVALPGYLGAVGTRITGETRNLFYDERVYANEQVVTNPSGATNLVFLDQTNLYVGANSTVVLDKFVYDPSSGNGDVAITFAKGAFRFVTGQIRNKEAVSLRTPTAAIVIRGTDIALFVLDDGTSEINVLSGAADVFVCEEREPRRVETGQSLLISASCESAPGSARTLAGSSLIPEMPTELAQLADIVPAAGGNDPFGETFPGWEERGKRNDERERSSDNQR